MTDTTLDQRIPATPTKRRRRTDADRLADMQAELARLKAAGEAKAIATAVAPQPPRERATRGRPKSKPTAARRGEDALDSELRELVESFVAALRDVIRRELVAQAQRSLMRRAP